jgi:hypothetical protein
MYLKCTPNCEEVICDSSLVRTIARLRRTGYAADFDKVLFDAWIVTQDSW